MAEKIWTAVDLEFGKLTIRRSGQELQIERRYKFLDAGSNVLEQIKGGRIRETIAIVDIPADILDAWRKIDSWTKNKALVQEGMCD